MRFKKILFVILTCLSFQAWSQGDGWWLYGPKDLIFPGETQSKFMIVEDYLYRQHDTVPYRTAKKLPFIVFNTAYASPSSWTFTRQALLKEPEDGFELIVYPKFNLTLVEIREKAEGQYSAILEYNPGSNRMNPRAALLSGDLQGMPLQILHSYRNHLVATSDTSHIKFGGNKMLSHTSMLIGGPTLKQDSRGYYISFLLEIPLKFDEQSGVFNHYYLALDQGEATRPAFNYTAGLCFVEMLFEMRGENITLSKTSVLADSFEYFPDKFNPLQKEPIRYERKSPRAWLDKNYYDRLTWSNRTIINGNMIGKSYREIMNDYFKDNDLWDEWIENCEKCSPQSMKGKSRDWQLNNCNMLYLPIGMRPKVVYNK